MKLYHIDRLGTLKDGQKIELQSLENLTEEVQNLTLQETFKTEFQSTGKVT